MTRRGPPDGSRIVLRQALRRPFYGDLTLVELPTRSWRRLTHTPHDDQAPTWSADGSRIAFVSKPPVGARSWSPDGRWLPYTTNERWYWEDIYIVPSEGGTKIDLTPESASFDIEPAWQPLCIVAGTAAGDELRGTPADELICGHGGADTVIGGRGTDRLFGGAGNDRMRAFDRSFDIVGCGAGRDDVVADQADLVGSDCERVVRR